MTHNCPQGYVWVDTYRKKDGTVVRGHCREGGSDGKLYVIWQEVD